LCGLTIFWGLRSSGPGRWPDGWFYNPDDGDTYNISAELRSADTIDARIYLGGRFVWPRAEEGVVVLSRAPLSMLLEGIDWRMPRRTFKSAKAAFRPHPIGGFRAVIKAKGNLGLRSFGPITPSRGKTVERHEAF